jgi:hypothetical protein
MILEMLIALMFFGIGVQNAIVGSQLVKDGVFFISFLNARNPGKLINNIILFVNVHIVGMSGLRGVDALDLIFMSKRGDMVLKGEIII